MNIAELKNNLIQLAIETDSPAMLEKVIAYFRYLQGESDWWDTLSEADQAFIEHSSRQIDQGEVISGAEMRAGGQEWWRKPAN
jgi:hypothetical protein